MNRREQRRRRNPVTRTYPIYHRSISELSDNDDDTIEIRPVRRHRRHRKQPVNVQLQEPNVSSFVIGKNIRA